MRGHPDPLPKGANPSPQLRSAPDTRRASAATERDTWLPGETVSAGPPAAQSRRTAPARSCGRDIPSANGPKTRPSPGARSRWCRPPCPRLTFRPKTWTLCRGPFAGMVVPARERERREHGRAGARGARPERPDTHLAAAAAAPRKGRTGLPGLGSGAPRRKAQRHRFRQRDRQHGRLRSPGALCGSAGPGGRPAPARARARLREGLGGGGEPGRPAWGCFHCRDRSALRWLPNAEQNLSVLPL